MEDKKLVMTWSLERLYKSFQGEEFQNDLKYLDSKIEALTIWSNENLHNCSEILSKAEEYIGMLSELRELSGKLASYASLSFSADANNNEAKRYLGVIEKKSAKMTSVNVKFAKWLGKIENLDNLIKQSDLLSKYEFFIKERLRESQHLLSEKEEIIISNMKLTGSSAWANLKNQLASNLTIDIEINGEPQTLGINKIKNMLLSDDKDLRRKAFYAERNGNEKIAQGVAATLNGIKGEVVTLCDLKRYESPLHRTLEDSRMDEETLNTLISVMKESLGDFRRYYLKKAELLGHKGKLPYYDLMAPIGNKEKQFTYEEARDFIVKHFSSFTNDMGKLAQYAFDNRWIDAESREGKRSGAFCHNLHSIKESRVLCSFDGSFKNVCTLAHELGHAYHGMILQDESILNSSYPMPLAETASIFAENMVRNAALKTANKEEELVILGAELVNSSSVIVDIYARFLFEKELFNRRINGELSLDEIKEIMVNAQKEAYGDAIEEDTFDPYAWLHKPHYYYADRNFYNFPYAFGLLFSKGLYSIYLKEGEEFVDKYNNILRLTGQATVYDVAKYAGIDIHDKEFWRGSINLVKEDIDKFCKITI